MYAVDSFVSYAGERWDFVVEATANVGNYWMRFRGLMDCDERFTKAFTVAILHYDGADDGEPEGMPTYDNTIQSGIVNTNKIIRCNRNLPFRFKTPLKFVGIITITAIERTE